MASFQGLVAPAAARAARRVSGLSARTGGRLLGLWKPHGAALGAPMSWADGWEEDDGTPVYDYALKLLDRHPGAYATAVAVRPMADGKHYYTCTLVAYLHDTSGRPVTGERVTRATLAAKRAGKHMRDWPMIIGAISAVAGAHLCLDDALRQLGDDW